MIGQHVRQVGRMARLMLEKNFQTFLNNSRAKLRKLTACCVIEQGRQSGRFVLVSCQPHFACPTTTGCGPCSGERAGVREQTVGTWSLATTSDWLTPLLREQPPGMRSHMRNSPHECPTAPRHAPKRAYKLSTYALQCDQTAAWPITGHLYPYHVKVARRRLVASRL